MAASAGSPESPLVAIVVLNWNGWDDTIDCLTSLEALEYEPFRVLVVDNASAEPAPSAFDELFPNATLLRTTENLGFGGGNNVGIRHVLEQGAEFVWLLNNDTTVAPDSLSLMVNAALEDPLVGLVGAVLYHADAPDRVQVWGGGRVGGRLATVTVATAPTPLNFLCGASMLVRRAVFEDVGLLDERFFFFMEDVDFSRMAARRGWRLAVAGGAAVWHKGGASVNRAHDGRSSRADRLYVRSTGVFIGKHAGALLPVAAAVRLAAIAARRLSRGEARRMPALTAEFVGGLRNGYAGRGG